MPEYLFFLHNRYTFATKTMNNKIEFRNITEKIKEECLCFGYGTIRFDKEAEGLCINSNENILSICTKVDTIKIDCDVIMLCEDNQNMLTFDQVCSIDRQIQIYETIYKHQDQLRFYELDWNNCFNALRVTGEDGQYYWRILSPDEAKHVYYNGKRELFQIYDDGTEGMIDDEERLNECINNGYSIGISLYFFET